MTLVNAFIVAGRYVVLATTGDLYFRTVRSEDGLLKFNCVVTNILNGERQSSDEVTLQVKRKMKYWDFSIHFITIIITELNKKMAPRSSQKPVMEIEVARGTDVHLPCNIQGNPFPIFT